MTDHLPGFFEGTEMPTAGWWEALWPDPAKVLQSVGLAAGMDVIDLCSGDGWFTLQVARIARRVDAVDLDEKLLEVARRARAAQARRPLCRRELASASTRGDADPRRAARPAHRPETVAATDDRG